MSEFEDKLNSILSSPQEMEKIMGLARSLSGSMGKPSEDTERQYEQENDHTDSPFGNIDPNMLKMMSRLMGEYSASSGNDKSALLNSLKPYLKDKRKKDIDKAIEIAKLAKIAKIAFSEFSGGESDF